MGGTASINFGQRAVVVEPYGGACIGRTRRQRAEGLDCVVVLEFSADLPGTKQRRRTLDEYNNQALYNLAIFR